MRLIPPEMEGKYRHFLHLYKACTGSPQYCCGHIVLEDGNITDGNIDFCIKAATKQNHVDCLALMQYVKSLTVKERIAILRLNPEDYDDEGEAIR